MRLHRFALLSVVAVPVLSACVSDPSTCRNADSVWVAGGCVAGGGFEAALQEQRDELKRLQELRRLTELEERALLMTAEDLAGDVEEYNAYLSDIESELAVLRGELNAISPDVEEKRAKHQVLLQEIDSLEGLLKAEKVKESAEEAQIFKLNKEIEIRRTVLRSMTRDILQE